MNMKEISITAATILIDLSKRIGDSQRSYNFEPFDEYVGATNELVNAGLLVREQDSYKPTSDFFNLSSKLQPIFR